MSDFDCGCCMSTAGLASYAPKGCLRAEVGQLRAALWDLINRWSTEEGYDGAIQRARALLIDSELRRPISNRDG